MGNFGETYPRRGGFCPDLRYLPLKVPVLRRVRCLVQSKIRLALVVCGKCRRPLKRLALAFGGVLMVAAVWALLQAMQPAAPWPPKAWAKKLDLTSLAPGEPLRFHNDGQWIEILRLSEQQIAYLNALEVDVRALPDRFARNANLGPEALATYENRVLQRPEADFVIFALYCDAFDQWPLFNAGDYHGWFCMRPAGHLDILGRVHRGGMWANFPIPRYAVSADGILTLTTWEDGLTEDALDRILYGAPRGG